LLRRRTFLKALVGSNYCKGFTVLPRSDPNSLLLLLRKLTLFFSSFRVLPQFPPFDNDVPLILPLGDSAAPHIPGLVVALFFSQLLPLFPDLCSPSPRGTLLVLTGATVNLSLSLSEFPPFPAAILSKNLAKDPFFQPRFFSPAPFYPV